MSRAADRPAPPGGPTHTDLVATQCRAGTVRRRRACPAPRARGTHGAGCGHSVWPPGRHAPGTRRSRKDRPCRRRAPPPRTGQRRSRLCARHGSAQGHVAGRSRRGGEWGARGQTCVPGARPVVDEAVSSGSSCSPTRIRIGLRARPSGVVADRARSVSARCWRSWTTRRCRRAQQMLHRGEGAQGACSGLPLRRQDSNTARRSAGAPTRSRDRRRHLWWRRRGSCPGELVAHAAGLVTEDHRHAHQADVTPDGAVDARCRGFAHRGPRKLRDRSPGRCACACWVANRS